jgi:MFS family permease
MTIRSFGQGLVIVQVALVITSGVPTSDQGIAAGLFNMSGQLGGSIGLAGIATVLAAASAAAGGGRLGELHGIRVAFVVAAALPLVATAFTVFGLRNQAAERSVVESEPTSVEIAIVDEIT